MSKELLTVLLAKKPITDPELICKAAQAIKEFAILCREHIALCEGSDIPEPESNAMANIQAIITVLAQNIAITLQELPRGVRLDEITAPHSDGLKRKASRAEVQ